ncbi:MAG TPA: hypothetical protein VFH78_08630, partial [Candidatus Thermoplasmatota archaeon]|nr:hypothetical protein [Candidatus Thermoplasmatota archaeon]
PAPMRLSRDREHPLGTLRDVYVRFPDGRDLRPAFDRIGTSDIRVRYRLPGQGVGAEIYHTTEERTALDAAEPRIRQILRAGGRITRIWILPDEPAAPREVRA